METLGNYSNLRGGESPALALIEDARRCQIPTGNRNERPLRERARRLSEAEVAQLVEAYEQGDTVYARGRRFGIHRTTVSEHLRRTGVETRYRKRVELTVDEQERAVAAATEGLSVRRVATLLGATERVVARSLDEAGISRRRQHRPAIG